METPTITKKQAKKTLSGKKKKTEVIKTVLAKPYNNFWPLLNAENAKYLIEILEKFLPKLVPDKINIPYEKIKNVPKAERKKFRESLNRNNCEINTSDRKDLIFGVNDVSKLLENQEAASILVANEVQPRLLVQHIIDQAVLHNVPILVVSDLKAICKKKCGVSGAVVALKRSIGADSELGVIQRTIANIFENYPVPDNHINYHRKIDTSVISIPESEDGTSVCVISDGEEETSKNYHLRKESKKRVFVPEKSNQQKVEAFISLDSYCETPKKVKSDVKTRYHALKVKRVKGDKNRNKRKMETFKKKKK